MGPREVGFVANKALIVERFLALHVVGGTATPDMDVAVDVDA